MKINTLERSMSVEMRDLQAHLEEQNQRVAKLESQVQLLLSCNSPCPRCEQGEIRPDDDRLQCTVCDYAHPL